MADPISIVHYVNQFFGGIGGEEQANARVESRDGAVGPGRALDQALGQNGTVVATIIGGDNYIVEQTEEAMSAVREILERYKPDAIVAGPAFDAGRYGLACAEVCRQAQEMGIPAVTAMHPDNPGVIVHRQEIICVPTGTSATEMGSILSRMSPLALKLGRGEALETAASDDYLPRGLRRSLMREQTGAVRAADMLKAILDKKPFTSEVFLKPYETVAPPPPLTDLSDITFALITTGAVVPKGNPDNMPAAFATRFYKYSIEDLDELTPDTWGSVHAGFNTAFINTKNPSYALPLPAMRRLEATGVIKGILPYFYSTPGVATAVNNSLEIGAEMARELKEAGVGGALLVAT